MTAKTLKTRRNRHPFRFKIDAGDGPPLVVTSWATVRKAKEPVDLLLTTADVNRALELDGVGNTAKCAMAVCAKRQRDKFPHKVEGYIDWNYRTAHVVTAVDGKTRMPNACVVYSHHSNVARQFDTKEGLKKLLAILEKRGGSMTVTLFPPPKIKKFKDPQRPTTGHVAKRSEASKAKSLPFRGARLRFAVAQAGAVLPPPTDKAA